MHSNHYGVIKPDNKEIILYLLEAITFQMLFNLYSIDELIKNTGLLRGQLMRSDK